MNAAAKVLACEIVGLRLIDENDPSYVVLAASTGVDERSTRVLRRGPVTEGIGGRAIVEERLLISNDYGSGEGEIQMLAANGLRAAMAAPVHGHGSIVGSLVVATRSDRQFSEADADTLGFFAEYAGVALSTARAADAVRQALTDPLTGLPNRALFVDRLDHALARAERANGEVSVLFLDVDEFKLVNDSLGHLAGDRLLVETAKRIRKCVRRSDTAARLGGDEFAILVPHEADPTAPEILAARIIEALSAPFRVDGHELRVRASIGLATGRSEPESLLRDADTAMYRAKATKRGGLCVFEPGMQADTVRELELRNELLRAVACKEITAVFQPIVSLADGGIAAFEVLARWDHPDRGAIPPDVFIPLAQSAGVIQEIGSAILHEACSQLAGWRARHPGRDDLQISVNVSPEQLGKAFARDIEETLEANRLPPTALILELTETSLLHDSDAALALLAQLRSLGIQIAIDDFGTGLLVPALPTPLPGRRAQDREAVHRRHRAGERPGVGVRPPHHGPREHARPDHRRRGHRDARPARPARRTGLRLRPGLPLRAPGRGLEDRRRAHGRQRSHRPTARRVTRRPRPVEVHLDWTTSV